MNAPHFSTKERILGAAETLFARHGFAGASLRQVTAAANVNLAAVNYHFGSKDNLLDEAGGHAFMRVLARAYAEHDERLRKFLSENYGHVLREFAAAFARLLPHLGKEELYWRLDFITGALPHSMADFGPMKRRGPVSEEAHRERAAEHLIRFATAGLLAP